MHVAFAARPPAIAPCLLTCLHKASSCATAGVLGPVVAALGAMQAQIILAQLVGLAPSPLGHIVTLDMAGWRMGGFSFAGAAESPGFGPIAASQIVAGGTVVELRPAGMAHIVSGAQVIGLADLANWPLPDAGRLVLCCSSGLRAWRGAQVLTGRGARSLVLLADGQ